MHSNSNYGYFMRCVTVNDDVLKPQKCGLHGSITWSIY